jgi:DNA modification methylase
MRPYYQDDYVTLYHGDCREIVPTLGKFDLLLTDPPYGIGADKRPGGVGEKSRLHKWDDSWDSEVPELKWLLDVTVSSIIWGYHYMADQLGNTKAPVVWDKKCKNGWDDNFADVEIAWTRGFNTPTCFRYQWMGACRGANTEDGAKVHPTQKPMALMRWCIERYSDAEQTILDPYAGAGATGRAAKDLQRKCTLIELEERYCEVAANRLRQEVLPLECG